MRACGGGDDDDDDDDEEDQKSINAFIFFRRNIPSCRRI
jgi:hypothetical protein